MARQKDRLSLNATGPFFVDSSCIDCGSCWQIDPEHFASSSDSSYVYSQPKDQVDLYKAQLALIDCPVSAIGAPKDVVRNISSDIFPILITKHISGDVYYCGWSSKRSFGASSWLVLRPEGNVLIDSPRWSAPLARQIKKMGGLCKIVLTHCDNVADHDLWAKAFDCPRFIHKRDAFATHGIENQVIGDETILLEENLNLIPTPGHTAGSIVILLGNKEQILFSGDHLWWNPELQVLVASKKYCWSNWTEQLRSVKKLSELDIRWLLPGHGHAHEFKRGEWNRFIENTLRYVEKIKT